MGDVVNPASRIEGNNKAQGTEVLLSAATCAPLTAAERAALGVEAAPRAVRVKGKDEVLLHAAEVQCGRRRARTGRAR